MSGKSNSPLEAGEYVQLASVYYFDVIWLEDCDITWLCLTIKCTINIPLLYLHLRSIFMVCRRCSLFLANAMFVLFLLVYAICKTCLLLDSSIEHIK